MSALRDGHLFEGHIDFYGFYPRAKGWFIGGWISHPWPPGCRPTNALATFADHTTAEWVCSAFYQRDDVKGRGIGFVFFLGPHQGKLHALRLMQVSCGDANYAVYPTRAALVLEGAQVAEHVRPILAGGNESSQCRQMAELLISPGALESVGGYIDYYGYHAAAAGWLFCGWIERGWHDEPPPVRSIATFHDGDVDGECFATLFARTDLKDGAEGIVLFLQGPAAQNGGFVSVSFEGREFRATLHSAPTTTRLREPELISRLRPLLAQGSSNKYRDVLFELLARKPYSGEDTIAGMKKPIYVEFDEAILCGPTGLLLMGWCLARPKDVWEMRVRCGSLSSILDLEKAIRIDRPDVIESFAAQGFDDPRCGFVVFLPDAVMPDERIYVEIETNQREVAYKNLPHPKLEGMAAIKRLLAVVDVRFSEIRTAFDVVVGPAVERLNRQRLAERPGVLVREYGAVPKAPRFTVIVPLYGRLDFVEYQMALFSAHPGFEGVEFIYVLDDPSKRREAQLLFSSVYERFLLPFRAVLLERNVGFAPANNIGLSYAHGMYVAYMNSDVFPGTPDWLERLAERLLADPTLGVVGPTLIFEDGSVQHRGMYFERLPEFGDWHFGMHHGKGMRLPSSAGRVERCISITGACMLMARSLADELGGFDEIYAIGDFEDSDLCLKVQALGLGCAVDPDVHLFHLERKSQLGSALGWRMNLTLYNAWQHERRWGRLISERQAS